MPNPRPHLTLVAGYIKSRKAAQGMFFGFAQSGVELVNHALANLKMSQSASISDNPWRRRARFGCWSFFIMMQPAMLFLLLTPIFLHSALVYIDIHNTTSINDFVKIYINAQATEHPNPYDADLQGKLIYEITKPLPIPVYQRYVWHTPILLAFAKPFVSMPPYTAYCVWLALSMIVGPGCVALLARSSGVSKKDTILILLATFCAMPHCFWWLMGQTTWFQVAAISLFYWAMRSKRNLLAGLALIFTLVKPQLSAIYFLVALSARRFSILGWSALGGLVLLGYILMNVMSFDVLLSYPRVLYSYETSKTSGNFTENQVGIRGMLTMMMPPDVALAVAGILFLASIVFVAYIWSKAAKLDDRSKDWLMAITVAANLAFSLHSMMYDCLAFVIPAALTLKSLSFFDAVKMMPLSLRIWTLLLLSYPVLSWFGPKPAFKYDTNIGFAILSLALFTSGAIYVWKYILPQASSSAATSAATSVATSADGIETISAESPIDSAQA